MFSWRAALAGTFVLATAASQPLGLAGDPSVGRESPGAASHSALTWTPAGKAAAIEALQDASFDGWTGAMPVDRVANDGELATAFADYVAALHTPASAAAPVYVDSAMRPNYQPGRVIASLQQTKDQAAAVQELLRVNPIYAALRRQYRHEPSALIRANMERARGLPVDLGDRYVLVDVASQQLWMMERGRPVGRMRVVVGKPDQPTPPLVGLIEYAVVKPYWNVPPDLVRDHLAATVLNGGLAAFKGGGYEAMSDWTDEAAVLDPATIDWGAVASGERTLPVRQRPGPSNMMGEVKFMFPNALGIYLHDTPDKALMKASQRTFSSGCVRLEDARRLGRWLLGAAADQIGAVDLGPETRINLPRPTPVYISYFTVNWTSGRVVSDIYNRDAPVLAELALKRLPQPEERVARLAQR